MAHAVYGVLAAPAARDVRIGPPAWRRWQLPGRSGHVHFWTALVLLALAAMMSRSRSRGVPGCWTPPGIWPARRSWPRGCTGPGRSPRWR